MQSTQEFSEQINKIKDALKNAEAIVIGAGAGLSTAAGLTYDGERFYKYFADFYAKYGITDMYSGGFYPFKTLEEYWAWWSRHILYNRYTEPPKPVYRELYALVKDKNYFVITTNVDDQFLKSGFDEEGNPITPDAFIFIDFGKCVILPNTKASVITLADGQKYTYMYEIYAPLNKTKYPLIPKEGDKVWITKKDGTIDKEMEVKGFVTLKKRYLRIWL